MSFNVSRGSDAEDQLPNVQVTVDEFSDLPTHPLRLPPWPQMKVSNLPGFFFTKEVLNKDVTSASGWCQENQEV